MKHKHPPYHLRINKAVDRCLLIDLMSVIEDVFVGIEDYTYFGMGGPFLEEVRLITQTFPKMNIVSLENDADTSSRQKFHRPSRKVKLKKENIIDFIKKFAHRGKCVCWLDYSEMTLSNLDAFHNLIQKVRDESIVKITLPAATRDHISVKQKEKFFEIYATYIPIDVKALPSAGEDYAFLLKRMLNMATKKALENTEYTFLPLHSCRYADGMQMLTLTGCVCKKNNKAEMIDFFSKWEYVDCKWETRPVLIDMPYLTSKERLALEPLLPCDKVSESKLLRTLGYCIEGNNEENREAKSKAALSQYRKYYRFHPHFVKVSL